MVRSTYFTSRIAVWLVVAWSCAAAVGEPPAGHAVDRGADGSVPVRWREHSFGLSLVPPSGSSLQRPPPPRALDRFILPSGSVIEVSIDQTRGGGDSSGELFSSFGVQGATRIESGDIRIVKGADRNAKMVIKLGDGLMTLDEVIKFTVDQVAVIDPKAVILDQRDDLKLSGGHPGGWIYFRIPAGREPEWILGLGVMQIDPRHFAVLRLESAPGSFDGDRAAFEATFRSLQVQHPRELDAWRRNLLESGDGWLRSLDAADLHAALQPQQWFRVMDGKQDIGWVKIEQKPEKLLGMNGVAVRIRSRLYTVVRQLRSGGRDVAASGLVEKAQDSDNFFFLSDDRQSEVWTILSTLRSPNSVAPRSGGTTRDTPFTRWEHGTTSGGAVPIITLNRGDQKIKWLRPDRAYLSQVELLLLGRLLPHEQETEMGFYAYHAGSGRLAFLTVHIVPGADGGFELRIRPRPDAHEHVYAYDAAGRLQRWHMPTGRLIVATTPDEMKRVWKGR